MNCAQIQSYIECYADGELDPVTSVGVEKHLHECATCARTLEELNAFRLLVKSSAPYHRAPDGLANAMRARIGLNSDAAQSRAHWWQWLRPVALVASTAVITWFTALQVQGPSKDEALVKEIVASHARSTLTGHLTNVASSERHVVKPWLSSKLDFSPPVFDLTAEGFPLIGGRLDYVDGRAVSALVYRRRQHVINLFIWPADGETEATVAPALSKQGYQVIHWTRGGMMFWVISDLNAGELKTFAEKFSTAK